MDLKERLEKELVKMKEEVDRCYGLADKNSNRDNDIMYHVWNSRANAFRDCIAIIEECIIKTN